MSKKKVKKDEQALAELSSAHLPFASTMPVSYKPVTLTNLIFFLCHITNILLTELSRTLWWNVDFGRVCKPHCFRSILTTLVKILPYGPSARFTWELIISYKRFESVSSHNISLAYYNKTIFASTSNAVIRSHFCFPNLFLIISLKRIRRKATKMWESGWSEMNAFPPSRFTRTCRLFQMRWNLAWKLFEKLNI